MHNLPSILLSLLESLDNKTTSLEEVLVGIDSIQMIEYIKSYSSVNYDDGRLRLALSKGDYGIADMYLERLGNYCNDILHTSFVQAIRQRDVSTMKYIVTKRPLLSDNMPFYLSEIVNMNDIGLFNYFLHIQKVFPIHARHAMDRSSLDTSSHLLPRLEYLGNMA